MIFAAIGEVGGGVLVLRADRGLMWYNREVKSMPILDLVEIWI